MTRMQCLMLSLAGWAGLQGGQTIAQTTLPEAPVEAMIEVSTSTPFVKETFTVEITIITRGVDIRHELNLINLPDPGTFEFIEPFKAPPIQREVDGPRTIETRRYRAPARIRVPGEFELAPTLQLTTRHRARTFFGSTIEERAVPIALKPVKLHGKALPEPPPDFSGAIGILDVQVTAAPLELVAGDLVTVRTRIQGEGWLEDLTIPAVHDQPNLKTYPVNQVLDEPQRRGFSQIVIPQSPLLTEIPAVAIVVFDTAKGDYVRHPFGPFPLRYRKEAIKPLTQFRPPAAEAPAAGTHGKPAARTRWYQWFIGKTAGVQAMSTKAVYATLAPSPGARITFSIPRQAALRVLDRHEQFVLIEHQNRRGWIRESAIRETGE